MLVSQSRGNSLNEQQYHAICEACDRLLLDPESTIERVAIPWLHVVREHPVFLYDYTTLFESSRSIKNIYGYIIRTLRNRASFARQIGRSLHANGLPWYGPKELPRGVDFLFVSHLLNPMQAGKQDDFYFGSLPDEKYSKESFSVIALINHTGRSGAALAEKWKGSTVPRVILSDTLRFSEELSLYRDLSKESARLRVKRKKDASDFSRRVLGRASEEALSGRSITALRICRQIFSLIKILQPKAIVVTYEGHAWERLSFAAARRILPNIRCIGYQHTALFRLQHAIRRNLYREYNPDQILTAGSVGKKQLENAPDLGGIPISALGSNRSFGEKIAERIPGKQERANQNDNEACLVLPEGIPSECHLLFNFSLDCARKYHDLKFIWRLHPLFKFEDLIKQNSRLRNLPKNIIVSKSTLEEDIRQCRWVLYRGTTAVIPAVIVGLRPIYLESSNQLSIDPLYELKGFRVSVHTISDFLHAIRGDQGKPSLYSKSEFMHAQTYCRDFFTPLNPAALESGIIRKSKVTKSP